MPPLSLVIPGPLPPVARKAPLVSWIGHRHTDDKEFIEEPVLEGPGLYGAIIHP